MESGRNLVYPAGGVRWPADAALDAMIAAEQLRSVRRYGGARDDLVRITSGSGVLVSAPHAVAHWREGARKPADMGTGFIAEALAEACGATTLVAEGEQSEDGNYYPLSAFRRQLTALLGSSTLVLDVHGMSDRYGVDVCLGTGRRPEMGGGAAAILRQHLSAAGFRVSVDDPYDAAKFETVTLQAHEAGVPAVQLELGRSVRRHLDDPEPCLLLIQVLVEAVTEITAQHTA